MPSCFFFPLTHSTPFICLRLSCVYVVVDGENERESAKMFLEFAKEFGGLSPEEVKLVEAMILATIAHSVPEEYRHSRDLKVGCILFEYPIWFLVVLNVLIVYFVFGLCAVFFGF